MATEQRKLVSVVFADVVGSTAFGSDNDPEAVRSVMGAYFERMKAIAELHGGTVEKFIGDAVMVVFGVPLLHDDDAERAVRAAMAMRDAMAGVNEELGVSLAARVGVNSGEAVAGGGADRQFLVTGDAVNVAARLQQGADASEVVVGPLTESLTRVAIEYAGRPAVIAKGKSEPIRAFRALRARSAVPDQARGLPAMRAQLVGRQRELRMLLDAFDRVRTERRAHLFTVVGNAGIGKSRLVGEALARISGAGSARVLRGRCLPYGAGITYWPLMEIIRDDTAIGSDDGRDAALAKLDARAADLLGAEAGAVRARLAVMLGLASAEETMPEIPAANVAHEIAWGIWQYLAAVAREPVVIVLDDLQWAAPTVFDVIDGLVARAEDAPLLLLAVARPQLLEAHSGWGGGRANAATITLDALSGEETTTLIARLLDVDDLPADLRARVVQRSEGNPLFCEEFLRMLIDEGRVERVDDRWRATATAADVRVPESIHALLAARLDGLAEHERRAMQVASIVGERFAAAEISALAPDLDVAAALAGLRRSGLIVEDRESRERDRYRFRHLLMRDVAYAGMPKAVRADLHDAFGGTLARAVGDRRDEFAEILGHHAERAFTLSSEVRAPRPIVESRARAALDWALALGERARRRQDVGLLGTSAATATAALAALADGGAPAERVRVVLLNANTRRLGGEYEAARADFERAAALATELGQPQLEAEAHLGAATTLVYAADEAELEAMGEHSREAERLFHESGDEGGAIEAGLIRCEADWGAGQLGALIDRGQQLLERARAIGDKARELQVCARVLPALVLTADRARADEYRATAAELIAALGARVPPWIRVSHCGQLRFTGDLDAAYQCYVEMFDIGRTEGDPLMQIGSYCNRGELMLDLRRYAEAQPFIEAALEISVRIGETWNRTELTADLALARAGQGDLAGAEQRLAEARALARPSDKFAFATVRLREAGVLEVAGREAEAAEKMLEAIALFSRGEWRHWLGIVHLEYAKLLQRIGRSDEAADALASAESRFGPQVGARAAELTAFRRTLGARKG